MKVMNRIDPILKELQDKVKKVQKNQPELERKSSISQQHIEPKKHPDLEELEKKIEERQTYLLPIYHQVSVQFADLHDTPERMNEKGAISVRFLTIDVNLLFNSFVAGYSSVEEVPKHPLLEVTKAAAARSHHNRFTRSATTFRHRPRRSYATKMVHRRQRRVRGEYPKQSPQF